MTPMFSIVVPVYNRAATIRDCLDSVQQQTYDKWECIVVDDGSSDGEELQAAVKSYEDDRFRYVRRENGGGGAARNTGIDLASAPFIAFLDSDDTFLPHKLERFSELVDENADLVWYSQVRVDRGVGRAWIKPSRAIEPQEDVGEYMFLRNFVIQTSSIVLPARIAKAVLFDPELRKGQDLDFCIRLQHAGVRFKMANEALSTWYDVTEHNRTSRVSGFKQPEEWLEAHKNFLTPRAIGGYRANVLAYHTAPHAPLKAIGHLFSGLVAGVHPMMILRQTVRAYLPREVYRAAVNGFVAVKGARMGSAISKRRNETRRS